MKKKKDVSGLIFSAFMITAFVVCSYFFLGLIDNSTSLEQLPKQLLKILVCVIFGALLFYATRIGDGRQVKRFSVATLLLLDLPALYILLASAAQGLPFPLDLTKAPEMVILAGVALGYGIPYTFLAGYELEPDEKKKETADNTEGASDEDRAEDEQGETSVDSDSEDTAAREEISETAETAESDETAETDGGSEEENPAGGDAVEE